MPGVSDDAERRLRQLGVRHVLAADAGPALISAEVTTAIADGVATGGLDPLRLGYAEPRAALPDVPALGLVHDDVETIERVDGRLVAVWGPTGAPGRTTVAVVLATEAARLGCSSLLADADCYGGVIAQVLGLLDESPGLAAAVRQANAGNLDLHTLATSGARRRSEPAGAHGHCARRAVAGVAAERAGRGLRSCAATRQADRCRLRVRSRAGRGAQLRHDGAAPQRVDARHPRRRRSRRRRRLR